MILKNLSPVVKNGPNKTKMSEKTSFPVRRSQRIEKGQNRKRNRQNNRYNFRPHILNPEKFGSIVYDFINQTVKDHAALENPKNRKKEDSSHHQTTCCQNRHFNLGTLMIC